MSIQIDKSMIIIVANDETICRTNAGEERGGSHELFKSIKGLDSIHKDELVSLNFGAAASPTCGTISSCRRSRHQGLAA